MRKGVLMEECPGKSGLRFRNPVAILETAGVAGKKEGQGPLGPLFDRIREDEYFGGKNWEDAESNLQRETLGILLQKCGVRAEDVGMLFAGDLLGQSVASSFGLKEYGIPQFGVYGACSTCAETLILGAMAVDGGYVDLAACVTSSHFASAEKEFRFPLEYGNQRPLSATWTVTGSGAFLLGRDLHGAKAKICGGTIGRITDYGIRDSMNMGACMAPAAADTILNHFQEWKRGPEDYDKIITGDLGSIGKRALLDLLKERGYDISDRHLDCGMLIYEDNEQDTHAGGSGCGCCAVTLASYIIGRLSEKIWQRILFLPTGALLSKTSFNEGSSIPAICHGLVLEAAD